MDTVVKIKTAGSVKRQTTMDGLCMKLEYEKGDVRFKGRPHERVMKDHYGHVPGTKGIAEDGEAVDVYVNPDAQPPLGPVYRIKQLKKGSGEFDESKYMVGYASAEAAKKAFLRNMPKWAFGSMTKVPLDTFREKCSMKKQAVKALTQAEWVIHKSKRVGKLRRKYSDIHQANRAAKLKYIQATRNVKPKYRVDMATGRRLPVNAKAAEIERAKRKVKPLVVKRKKGSKPSVPLSKRGLSNDELNKEILSLSDDTKRGAIRMRSAESKLRVDARRRAVIKGKPRAVWRKNPKTGRYGPVNQQAEIASLSKKSPTAGSGAYRYLKKESSMNKHAFLSAFDTEIEKIAEDGVVPAKLSLGLMGAVVGSGIGQALGTAAALGLLGGAALITRNPVAALDGAVGMMNAGRAIGGVAGIYYGGKSGASYGRKIDSIE